MQNPHRSIYKNIFCRCFHISMSPYLTTGYKLPSSPTCFMAWELEDLSHPTRWLHMERPEKIAEDARIVVQKVPVLIYTRTEGWILGYLQIQLCPISVWDKVTLHKGNAVCLIQVISDSFDFSVLSLLWCKANVLQGFGLCALPVHCLAKHSKSW